MISGCLRGKSYRELTGNVHYQAWIDSGGHAAFSGRGKPGGFSGQMLRGACADGRDLRGMGKGRKRRKGTGRRELRSACVFMEGR